MCAVGSTSIAVVTPVNAIDLQASLLEELLEVHSYGRRSFRDLLLVLYVSLACRRPLFLHCFVFLSCRWANRPWVEWHWAGLWADGCKCSRAGRLHQQSGASKFQSLHPSVPHQQEQRAAVPHLQLRHRRPQRPAWRQEGLHPRTPPSPRPAAPRYARQMRCTPYTLLYTPLTSTN